MKMALIFPRFKYPTGDIPLGIGYLASVIRDLVDLEVIDTTFKTKEEFEIKEWDVVAFSCMTTMVNDAYYLAQQIKEKYPKTYIIMGGPHATTMPDETLKNQYIDAVIIGEGEETLVDYVLSKKPVDGMWYKEGGKIIKNKPREPIQDLDSLPFPAWDLLPVEDYFKNWYHLETVQRNLKGTNIMSMRGCPYQCAFCQPTLQKIFGVKIRKRTTQNVIEELKQLKQKYNVNAFFFQDDTLIIDKAWITDLCNKIIENKLDMIWGCNARVNLVEKDMFEIMKKAGLRKVNIGVESGSQRILNIYKKGITPEQVKKAVDILHSLGLRIQGYFMVGAPTETRKEINQTIRFARSLDIDEATFSITTPLPGTYLYDQTLEHINKDMSELDYYKTSIYDKKISLGNRTLDYYKKKALINFYFHPKRLRFTLNSFIGIDNLKKTMKKLKRF